MIEGDFELDGVRWGNRGDLICSVFEQGGVEIRSQDAEVPGGHGVNVGRDLLGGDTWTWTIFTNTSNADSSLVAAREMSAVWRSYLGAAGRLAALRLMVGGRVLRVYGRPRRWVGPHGGVLTAQGAGRIDATFDLTDPLIYADAAESLSLTLLQSSTGVLTLPETLPWSLGRAEGQRQGIVTVAGDAPTPFEVTFHGPTSGTATKLWAQGTGWRVDLDASLAFDQSVTVDTRTHTVTRSDGLSLAGAARGRFLSARLSPGQQEVTWGATDPSNTARAEFRWRSAYYSL